MRRQAAVWAFAGASLLVLSTQAEAQTASKSTDNPAASSAGPATVGEVVVTGTRIISNGYTQPTPVTVAPTSELLKVQPTDIADALNSSVPQFLNSSSPSRSTHNFTSSAENGNILNLRGVGGKETLILLDGQRVPPTTFLGEVDVNVIPNLLVQRVDVVTGGASAVYGSDAVAGVVNFVLDRKFTGVSGEAQYGVSQRGDNQNYRFGVAVGAPVLDDRGHVLLSAETYNNDGMERSDRPISLQNYIYAGKYPGSTASPGSAANPYVLYKNASLGFANVGGLMMSGPFAGYKFINNGAGIAPFNPGTPTGTPGYYTNGDGFALPGNDTAIAPLNTKQLFGRFSYDITSDVTAYIQANYSQSTLDYSLEANGFVSPAATLFSGNPYLPSVVQNAMTASNTGAIAVTQYPFGPNPYTTETTDYFMVSAGLEGNLFSKWKWTVNYSHGQSIDRVDQENTLDWRKTFAAIDAVTNPATGQVTCNVLLNPAVASQYAGCSPLNILNPQSTPQGLAYALGTSEYRAKVFQDDVDFSLAGPLFELPAGTVQGAVGGEYRREALDLTSNSNPALLETTAQQSAYFAGLRGVPPGTLAYWLTNTGVANASQSVKEAFGELDIPVLKDLPFVQQFNLSAAGRITDYSTSGTARTWKLGATWRPVDDLMLRFTRSRDIRAPNLYELYAGAQSGIGQLYDPVTNRTDNVSTITSGNPNLKPEIGDTVTFGGVIQPRFLPGFSISIDYYRLAIQGQINTLPAQQIINDCVASGGSAPECQLITRPSAGAFPTLVQIAPANTAFTKTTGVDFDASYRRDVGEGRLGVRLYANYLGSYITQQSFTQPAYELAGTGNNGNQPLAYPKWRGNLNVDYKIGRFDAFVSEQYIGSLSLDSPEPNSIYENPNVGSVFYTNLTLTYDVPMKKGSVQTYLTVNNLFDKDPPLIPGPIPGVNLPTIISLYDTVGRAFTVGTRFKF